MIDALLMVLVPSVLLVAVVVDLADSGPAPSSREYLR